METENKTILGMIISNAVSFKVIIILFMTIFLIIPLALIDDQIGDRKKYEAEAQSEVAKGWGTDVVFGAAVWTGAEKSIYASMSDTRIYIDSKEKKRGIFKVPVYVATLNTKVKFAPPAEAPHIKLPDTGYLTIAVNPVTSIQNYRIRDAATGRELKAKVDDYGLRLPVTELANKDIFSNELEIEISSRGTGPVKYESSADSEKISMAGNWTKPKFTEQLLPDETKMQPEGFEAHWSLQSVPKWETSSRATRNIGLSHLWISTDYAKVERAVKYGQLFIALTFLLMFIVEFTSKSKIHPFQYGLIGISISVFYLLLLAISESTGFDIAYGISSVAVAGLIVFYAGGFLKQKKFVLMLLAEQLVLSGFFYLLLGLEEKAFLIGSIGLFAALAIFMSVTRRLDWYSGTFRLE
ncbi:MAG: Inner rane CreD family protein [Pseudobdellovibrio sp.]|jgi:inner membrane protein|nr:Inner rane CreD family protein [Pseudobdellovibrio sp.]